MRVRVYHDAHLVEAHEWAGSHAQPVLKALRTHAERELDQRWARNVMLNKWLEYCVERGHRFSSATRLAAASEPPREMKRTLASDLMKALRQLGFLKLNFRQEAPPAEEDRVLTLFRNRAELKKAYGGWRTRSIASRTASSSRKARRSVCRRCSTRSRRGWVCPTPVIPRSCSTSCGGCGSPAAS